MQNQFVSPPTELTEYVNNERAVHIMNLTFEDFLPIFATSNQKESQAKATYKKVIAWAIKHAEAGKGGGVKCTYRFSDDLDFGRMIGVTGIQGIVREIRKYVCVEDTEKQTVSTMTDVDMVNAHPVILQWQCNQYDIPCPYLTQFNADRATHMEEMIDKTRMSKDEVKSLFLAAMNSQNEAFIATPTKFFKKFDKEMKKIQEAFLKLSDYAFIMPSAVKAAQKKYEEKVAALRRDRKTITSTKPNVAGSFLNRILCLWENRLIGHCCQVLTDHNYTVCANCFDGVMIRGDHYPDGEESTCVDRAICPLLDTAVHDKFGITLKFMLKRHLGVLSYTKLNPDSENKILKIPYKSLSALWLKKICRVGSEYLIALNDGERVFESSSRLGDRLSAETSKCLLNHPDAPDWYKSTFAGTLCRDPAMRTYERAEMYPDPEDCREDVYNLWTPFPCDSFHVDETYDYSTSENVKIFRRLVLVLADNCPKLANFIELFISHMLKFPGIKPGAWLIMMSEEGTGKGTLIEIIKLLIGISKVKEINNVQRSLLGQFNQALVDGFLIVLDEADGKSLFQGSEQLKNMITGPTVAINQKNVQEKNIRNYSRFIVTLQPRPVPTKKGDRRGVIVCCSDELVGNMAFWTDINTRMFDPQFAIDVYAYLMTKSPPHVFPPDDLPQTDLQRQLQEVNSTVFDSWIREVVEKWYSDDQSSIYNVLGGSCQSSDTDMPQFIIDACFKHFLDFAINSNCAKQVEHCKKAQFVFYFTVSRWRKCFDYKVQSSTGASNYPRIKISNQQYQCRRWDMAGLAQAFNMKEHAAEFNQERVGKKQRVV